MDIEIMKTSFCLSTTYIEKSIVKCEESLLYMGTIFKEELFVLRSISYPISRDLSGVFLW